MKFRLIVSSLLLFCIVSSPVWAAEYRYITDSLEITMRAGNTTQHRITKMLRSGTRVEVLKVDGGWAEVVTPDGRQGWVLTRFLINSPVARDRLEKAEQELKALSEGDDKLRSQLIALQKNKQQLETQNTRLTASNKELNRELETLRAATSDTRSIMRSNKLLKTKTTRLNKEMAELRAENEDYKDNSAQTWFLRGAGVIFGGILLGLLLPRIPLPRRKKNMWSSL